MQQRHVDADALEVEARPETSRMRALHSTDHGSQGLTDGDWYLLSVRAVERAAKDLSAALETAVNVLNATCPERIEGMALLEIVQTLYARGGRQMRIAPTLAFHDFERAVSAHRALVVRSLVDEKKMNFSEVARVMGVSRQMIARLYRAAEPSSVAGSEEDV